MKHLNNENEFKDVIKEGSWLVDFSASWCGPCKMLEPNLEELSKEFNVLKVDIDKFRNLTDSFNIMSVPTIILFNDGKEVKQDVGYKSLDELKEFIK
jgi:thioredoxin 1